MDDNEQALDLTNAPPAETGDASEETGTQDEADASTDSSASTPAETTEGATTAEPGASGESDAPAESSEANPAEAEQTGPSIPDELIQRAGLTVEQRVDAILGCATKSCRREVKKFTPDRFDQRSYGEMPRADTLNNGQLGAELATLEGKAESLRRECKNREQREATMKTECKQLAKDITRTRSEREQLGQERNWINARIHDLRKEVTGRAEKSHQSDRQTLAEARALLGVEA